MKYYTYLMETYSGDKVEITVRADSEANAKERISQYKVSKGELKYFCKLLSVSETGTEKYYNSGKSESLAFLIGMMGAALGTSHVARYGQRKEYLTAASDNEVLYLIKEA